MRAVIWKLSTAITRALTIATSPAKRGKAVTTSRSITPPPSFTNCLTARAGASAAVPTASWRRSSAGGAPAASTSRKAANLSISATRCPPRHKSRAILLTAPITWAAISMPQSAAISGTLMRPLSRRRPPINPSERWAVTSGAARPFSSSMAACIRPFRCRWRI